MVQKKVCGFGKLPPPRETLWITLPPYRYCCSIALLVLDPRTYKSLYVPLQTLNILLDNWDNVQFRQELRTSKIKEICRFSLKGKSLLPHGVSSRHLC